MTERTSKFKKLYRLFFCFSLLCNIAPLTIYTIKALLQADLVHEKVSLTMTVFIVLILTAVSVINKVGLRSRLWIILIGIYICLDNILTPLILIAVCQVLDELIINPLKKRYKNKLIINKEMDRRL